MLLKNTGLLPELDLHTHNSIPGYFDDANEGCESCIQNRMIETIGNIDLKLDVEKVTKIIHLTTQKYTHYHNGEFCFAPKKLPEFFTELAQAIVSSFDSGELIKNTEKI